jgi:hypothetical protein
MYQPAVSADIFKIQLCRDPRKGCPSTAYDQLYTLQPLYKRVLIYSAFLWSGSERIVVYFAPNIQGLGLILIVFFLDLEKLWVVSTHTHVCFYLTNRQCSNIMPYLNHSILKPS